MSLVSFADGGLFCVLGIAAVVLLFLLGKLFRSYPLIFIGIVGVVIGGVALIANEQLILGLLWLVLSILVAIAAALNLYKSHRAAIWWAIGALIALIVSPFVAYDVAIEFNIDFFIGVGVPVAIVLVFGILFGSIVPAAMFKDKKNEKKHLTNNEPLIGEKVFITKDPTDEFPARATIGDVDWAVKAYFPNETFKEGDKVKIYKIEGVTLVCIRDGKDYRSELREQHRKERAEAKAECEKRAAERKAKKLAKKEMKAKIKAEKKAAKKAKKAAKKAKKLAKKQAKKAARKARKVARKAKRAKRKAAKKAKKAKRKAARKAKKAAKKAKKASKKAKKAEKKAEKHAKKVAKKDAKKKAKAAKRAEARKVEVVKQKAKAHSNDVANIITAIIIVILIGLVVFATIQFKDIFYPMGTIICGGVIFIYILALFSYKLIKSSSDAKYVVKPTSKEVKKAPAKKVEVKKAPAKKPVAKKAPAKKAPAKKPAPKAPAKKPVVKAPVAPVVAKKAKAEFVPFTERMKSAPAELKDAYNVLKSEILSYGIKSRVSGSGDTFRLHTKEYVKMVIAGKTLKMYMALDPKDYKDSSIPHDDASRMAAHKETPFVFRIKSGLAVRRAKDLIAECAKKDGLVQGEVVEHNHAKDL